MTDTDRKPVLDGVDDDTLFDLIQTVARKRYRTAPWMDYDDLVQAISENIIRTAKYIHFETIEELEGILGNRAGQAAKAERDSWENFQAQYIYPYEMVRDAVKSVLRDPEPESLGQAEAYADILQAIERVPPGRRLAMFKIHRDGLPANKTEQNQARDGIMDVFRYLNRKALAGNNN